MSTKKNSVASLKIGKNERAEKIFKAEINSKIVSFQGIEKFAQDLDLTIDKKELYANPKEAIIKAFDLDTKEGVLKRLSVEKKIDLFDLDVSTLDTLVKGFLVTNHKCDAITYDYKSPSFDIVLKGEEAIKKYKATEEVIKAIRGMEQFINVKPMDVVRMSQGSISFDPSTMELKPALATR